jgi:tRNA pseudouridine38/39 synthase
MLIFLWKYSLRQAKAKVTYEKKASVPRPFEPSNYTTRYVAFKLAYLGQRYNGFEHHANNNTPLPTVEEELWKAFAKARLISTKHSEEFASRKTRVAVVDWEGTEFSKCGRTDKGVSAFGQVIGLRVRSNRPLIREPEEVLVADQEQDESNTKSRDTENDVDAVSESEASSPFDDVADEIDYPRVLNRLLPTDIRILAWCHTPPPEFSARFSCRERRYKYFFTNPAFSPETKGAGMREDGEGWLDIEAMRRAAKSYVGLYDFRNFCKVDGSKQLSNFERRIFYAEIEEAGNSPSFTQSLDKSLASSVKTSSRHEMTSTDTPKVYTFTLHGSAFLWHQVRHMVAILFLIGQGLEPESLVDDLLDPKKYPGRPVYDLANDAPLVLWDCIFPAKGTETGISSGPDSLNWVYACEDQDGVTANKPRRASLVDDIWRVWRERKIAETLAAGLLDVITEHRMAASHGRKISPNDSAMSSGKGQSQRIFDGGDYGRLMGKYLPVHRKEIMDTPDYINERYRVRKGIPDPIVDPEEGVESKLAAS